MHESFYPWSKFPALGISTWTIYIHLQRRDKNDEKLSTYKKKYISWKGEREKEREELPSIQARGKDDGGFISRVMHTHASASEH